MKTQKNKELSPVQEQIVAYGGQAVVNSKPNKVDRYVHWCEIF